MFCFEMCNYRIIFSVFVSIVRSNEDNKQSFMESIQFVVEVCVEGGTWFLTVLQVKCGVFLPHLPQSHVTFFLIITLCLKPKHYIYTLRSLHCILKEL